MGFGSYDESEQQRRNANATEDESEGVTVREHDHEGTVEFETDVPTSDLLGRLKEMKAAQARED
jgi:hypothetical protein